jgi:hypothetical protein
MNRILIIVVVVIALFRGLSLAQDAVNSTNPAYVTGITFMGGLWQNENRGGFYFMTDNLPQGIEYFIARGGSESYVNRLLSILLTAKTTNKRVAVAYIQHGIEGDVVAIAIE